MPSIPAIGQITDPSKVRVALIQGQQIVSAPATALSDAVGLPAGGTTGQVLTKSSGTDYDTAWANTGNFSGPASATNGNLVAFDGATGKLGKDSGKKPADFATALQGAKADTAVQPSQVRELLTANRTYYVAKTGSDSNDGLTSGTAFLTVQKAVNVLLQKIDLGGFNVTISVASGTYSGNVTVSAPWVGSGSVSIIGDTTTPTNCKWRVTSGTPLTSSSGGNINVGGFHFADNGVGSICVKATLYGQITISGACQFGAVSAAHIYMFDGGIVNIAAATTISGDAPYFVIAESLTFMRWQNVTCTLSGARTFTAFVRTSSGVIVSTGITFTGSATGARYQAVLSGAINTFGSGATYFPGSTAGTTATGGQYA